MKSSAHLSHARPALGLRIMSIPGPRKTLLAEGTKKRGQGSTSVISQDADPRAENGTHLTPLPLNSSAMATPLARMRRRLKVAAVLIPVGNPVEFFVSLNLFSSHEYRCAVYWHGQTYPAGPSCIQRAGIPRRETSWVSPTHLESNCPLPVTIPIFSSRVSRATVALARV